MTTSLSPILAAAATASATVLAIHYYYSNEYASFGETVKFSHQDIQEGHSLQVEP